MSNSTVRSLVTGTFLVALLLPAACTRHEVELKPVEIKPIHITIDINLKVDRALDDFFGDIDKVQADPSALKP